jgi:hypothetical protein
MNYMPVPGREATPREKAYLSALAAGERRPAISGQAGHMCRRFGWCEALYRLPDGSEAARSELPLQMDAIAIARAGFRAVGYRLTARGRTVLDKG